MDARLVSAQCHTSDFTAVEAKLREWPEVEAVGSFREKSNNKKDLTTVFVTFTDENGAKGAAEKLSSIKELIPDTKSDAQKKNKNSTTKEKRTKNLAVEFMKFDSNEERKRTEESNSTRGRGGTEGAAARGRGRGRGGGGRRDNDAEAGDKAGEGASARSGRGAGRGRGGQSQNRQQTRGRGRGRQQQSQRLPPMEANVAFADNVPFGTTNDNLMELFSSYGRVLDINRLELMAMACYDNPESVQQCIQHLNGTKVGANTITVSSGVVRIPGNVAAFLGM